MMYRKEKRIPTLLALFILMAAVAAGVYFDPSTQSLFISAKDVPIPAEIHVTNVTHESFSVSWLTETETSGSVTVTSANQKQVFLDDLDTDNVSRLRLVHYVTVKNLSPDSSYTVKITSGKTCKNESYCPTFTQKTGVKLTSQISIPPVRGSVLHTDMKPANSVLVYLTIGKSAPLSTRTDSAGLWVIPLNNIRMQDLAYPAVISDNDLISISVKSSLTETAAAIVDVKTIKEGKTPLIITLGISYNFLKYKNTDGPELVQGNVPRTLGIGSTDNLGVLDFYFPRYDGDVTPDTRPRLRGKGIAGKKLTVRLYPSQQTGAVIIGSNGAWSWRPPKELAPGFHQIQIQSVDSQGQAVSATRTFAVLKSGEAVLAGATASASLTPTVTPVTSPSPTIISPTPTITPTVTIEPSPTAVVSPTTAPTIPPPKSGNSAPVVYFIGTGIFFLTAAAILLIL